MHLIDVEHASWYRALTLTERLASSGENRRTGQHAAVDWGRAERRLARWHRSIPVFGGRPLRATSSGGRDERTRPATAAR